MKKAFFIIFLAVFSLILLPSMEILGIEGRMGGVLYGYGGDPRYTTSPLVNYLSASALTKLSDHFEFQPELSVFFFNYVWDSEDSRAVPAAIETADRISIFHFLINPVFTYVISSNEKISYGVTMSPSLLLRVPLEAADNGNDYKDEISRYLYSNFRFFYPTLGGIFRWKYSEKTAFSVSGSMHLPVFHLWDGAPESFWDQMMVTGSIGFLLYL